ncbi:hypothetical protein DSO57_1003992 [Entomophthora muscae]|uniref:Uncharacterized protein n=1 Tax=Entomophthora muscae TaxID=34485 RepID=A0ACC2SKZ6_9FUNG|nr:hypothetical protein DSO57_1003992 [Entomophthora muscae]
MSSLLLFERAKFGVLCVKAAAAERKEVPTSLLEEAWASLEVSKIAPEEYLVEVKAAFEELYSNYFSREGTLAQGNQKQRGKEYQNYGSLERDDNKALSHKIASLEAKLLKALSQEDTSNKSQGQDKDLDLSHPPFHKWVWFNIHPFWNIISALD